MTSNMYRVGDYVYFESSHSSPYQIRRIEELVKTPSGGVEAKVICFYRRQDIPSTLISLADKHQIALEEEQEREIAETLDEKHRHQVKHRELFFSRQMETIPATHIRGKCTVTLLNETESLASYLDKEDTFFYTLVYEPNQKTLLADRGEIRVGSRYQAEITARPSDSTPVVDDRDLSKLETLVYHPDHSLKNEEIEQYITIAKSIGTFARALDPASSLLQPSLHVTAATASRDVTVQYAMDVLHQKGYDIGKALLTLCSAEGPVVCRDELEEWSPTEAQLFEDALEKYGKNFWDIRQEVLPWKSMRNIIEYYYMWKTTDRYVQQKRVKTLEAESKLKQVYIPSYNSGKQQISNGAIGSASVAASMGAGALHGGDIPGKPCESCSITSASQWFAWGTAHMSNRLCSNCWTYYKKFGGLRYPSKAEAEKALALKLVSGNGTNSNASSSNGSLAASPGAGQTGANAGNPESPAQYPCRECNKVFNRQERLVTHMASHRQITYKCSTCSKEFRQKAQLVRHEQQTHGLTGRSTSPRPVMKTRAAFYLASTPAARAARYLCRSLLQCRRLARKPFVTINITQIKQECSTKLVDGQLPKLPVLRPRIKTNLRVIAKRVCKIDHECPDWLVLPTKNRNKETKTNGNSETNQNGVSGNGLTSKKRNFDHQNGSESETQSTPLKRRSLVAPVMNQQPTPEMLALGGRSETNNSNGKARVSIARIGGKNKVISWSDSPDDLFFVVSSSCRKLRKQVQNRYLKRFARRPAIRIDPLSLSKSAAC